MEIIEDLITQHWIWFAVPVSLFWGLRSAHLFGRGYNKKEVKDGKEVEVFVEYQARDKVCWMGYQFLLNFFSSIMGWACFYILTLRVNPKGCSPTNNLMLPDLVLFLLALMGLTGSLPQLSVNLPAALVKLTENAANRLSSK